MFERDEPPRFSSHAQSKNAYTVPSVWGGAAEMPLFIHLALGCLLALLTPEDILTTNTAFKEFADWMSSIVPSINSISSISSFPEVTKFFFSMMWFCMPLVAAAYFYTKYWPFFKGWAVPVSRVAWSFKNILLAIVFSLMCWVIVYKLLTETGFKPADITYVGGRGKAFLTLLSQNRFALAMVGTLMTVISAFIVSMTMMGIANIAIRFRLFLFPLTK
jgi:hypothetical protein